jgi:hypothetical protein
LNGNSGQEDGNLAARVWDRAGRER